MKKGVSFLYFLHLLGGSETIKWNLLMFKNGINLPDTQEYYQYWRCNWEINE